MNNIRFAMLEDKDMILSLYHSLIGTPGCTWTMEYPTIEEIEHDIENKSLYCMCEDNEIVAVATAGHEDGYEHLNWDLKVQKPCFLS